MNPKQEPKYTTDEKGSIVNRASGVAIPDDEPVFIFRARDYRAVEALLFYEMRCHDPEHRRAVIQRIADFKRFASEHPDRMKEPDTGPAAKAKP